MTSHSTRNPAGVESRADLIAIGKRLQTLGRKLAKAKTTK